MLIYTAGYKELPAWYVRHVFKFICTCIYICYNTIFYLLYDFPAGQIWEDNSNDESEENDSSEAEVTDVLCTVSIFLAINI